MERTMDAGDGAANTTTGCWFCDDTARGEPPPGGWLIDDGVWRAGAAPASMAIPGTVVLETRRHVLDQADFVSAEEASFARVTGRLTAAIRAAGGCDRVYQWATMDAHPHFHLWLLPWWASGPLRGPRYLIASVFDVVPDTEATLSMASRIAVHLDRTS